MTDATNPYNTETVTIPSRLLLRVYAALDCCDCDFDEDDAYVLERVRDVLLAQAPYASSTLIKWMQTSA